jgi:shikimate kinase
MSITIIGMPGVGKSFIGKALAERLGWDFIDIDVLLEKEHGCKIQDLLDKAGDDGFLKLEEDAVLGLEKGGNTGNAVISPGGSIVYCPKAMEFLKKNSKVIYLEDSVGRIKARVHNRENRGIVGLKRKSFEELFREREVLYRKYADITISVSRSDDWNRTVSDALDKAGLKD